MTWRTTHPLPRMTVADKHDVTCEDVWADSYGDDYDFWADVAATERVNAKLTALAAAARQGGNVKQAPGETPQSGGDSRNAPEQSA